MKPYLVPVIFTTAMVAYVLLVAWAMNDWLLLWALAVGGCCSWMFFQIWWRIRFRAAANVHIQALREAYQAGRADGRKEETR